MTAIVLPDLDRNSLAELKKHIPDLSEFELPKMENVSKTADATIDKLLGRSKAPIWPWVAAGIGLVAVVGLIAAYFAWLRRPAMTTTDDAWTTDPVESTPSDPWTATAVESVTVKAVEEG